MTSTADVADAGQPGDLDDEGTLLVEPYHFAIVPEWVIDADISDAAYRLYSVLLRYGQSSGRRMPSRALLARRLRKRSVDSVDRAMKELVGIGAVTVEARHRNRQQLSNRYHLRTSPPRGLAPEPTTVSAPMSPRSADDADRSQSRRSGAGRKSAAPLNGAPKGGRKSAARGSRTDAARGAADLRPDPVVLTQENNPPPTPATPGGSGELVLPVRKRRTTPPVAADAARLCATLGLDSLETLAEQCRQHRRALGKPTALWTATAIGQMLHRSIHDDGWPVVAAVPALLALAADPATHSPARLPCPGPWWNAAEQFTGATRVTDEERFELRELEGRLAEADGYRVTAQRRAREQLTAEGEPVTRLTVARRACQLLGARPDALDVQTTRKRGEGRPGVGGSQGTSAVWLGT